MPNTKLLDGMCCPECGSEGPFLIEVTMMVLIHDDGPDPEDETEKNWDNDSYCECPECHHHGAVRDFDTTLSIEGN
ncbi:MAG: hypothetical protein ABFD96_19305 [Armatimonadia bacterium]